MEIFELRYFLGVAQTENIHKASEKLLVSPASLSKAVARLESELGTRLFLREGRNIQLTEQGRYLKDKALEILRLEESTRVEISGTHGKLHATIAGPEILLCHFGTAIADKISKKHPESTIEYVSCSDEEAIEKVKLGDVQLAIISGVAPREITSKVLSETKFKIAVGNGHPLYKKAKSGKTISVEEVLNHSFVSPTHASLGKVGLHQSSDGWRDDQFPRKIRYKTSSLKMLEKITFTGKALAYLPDYLFSDLNLVELKTTGCPYQCTHSIQLIAKRPKEVGWIQALF